MTELIEPKQLGRLWSREKLGKKLLVIEIATKAVQFRIKKFVYTCKVYGPLIPGCDAYVLACAL